MKKTKKLKKQKEKFEDSDWRQALDYSSVMMASFCYTMQQCAVLKDPEIEKAFEVVGEIMTDFYQLIGSKAFEEFEELANDY